VVVSLHLFVGVIAGLLPTFVLSRLALWALPRRHGLRRLIVAHAASWLGCALLSTLVVQTPGEPFGLRAAVILIFPQLCWMIFDIVRDQVAAAARGAPAASQPVRRRLI